MTVRDTSILSWQELKASGKFATQKEAIFQAVAMIGPMTRRRIAQVTGFEISAVCGAVNALVEKELRLVDGKTVKCETTGRTVHLVELPNQMRLAL